MYFLQVCLIERFDLRHSLSPPAHGRFSETLDFGEVKDLNCELCEFYASGLQAKHQSSRGLQARQQDTVISEEYLQRSGRLSKASE